MLKRLNWESLDAWFCLRSKRKKAAAPSARCWRSSLLELIGEVSALHLLMTTHQSFPKTATLEGVQ